VLKENDVERMIKTIFLQVFEVSPGEITDQTRRGELERWDSLGHLVLLESLREEFRIEIEPEQALEMETIKDIKRLVTTLVNKRDSC
jgi:acyl carrier protein